MDWNSRQLCKTALLRKNKLYKKYISGGKKQEHEIKLRQHYRPISLLPIFGKIFEKVIYKNLFDYFHHNKFLSEHQSGFRSGDSCISQLIAITHELYKSFDGTPSLDTRGVFLDISKAFDKVWHEGLLYKLKCYGVDGDFYNILENYLRDRKQRVGSKCAIISVA